MRSSPHLYENISVDEATDTAATGLLVVASRLLAVLDAASWVERLAVAIHRVSDVGLTLVVRSIDGCVTKVDASVTTDVEVVVAERHLDGEVLVDIDLEYLCVSSRHRHSGNGEGEAGSHSDSGTEFIRDSKRVEGSEAVEVWGLIRPALQHCYL